MIKVMDRYFRATREEAQKRTRPRRGNRRMSNSE